jgi:hypothetical protein
MAEQTAKALMAFDRARHVVIRWWNNESAFETLMRSLAIVMRDILSNCEPQMTFAKKDELAQTFALDRKYESLCESVEIWAPCWQAHRLHTRVRQKPTDIFGEDRISVHDEMRLANEKTVLGVQKISHGLHHPCTRWSVNDAADFNTTRSQVDDDEHVIPNEPMQSQNLHG